MNCRNEFQLELMKRKFNTQWRNLYLHYRLIYSSDDPVYWALSGISIISNCPAGERETGI